MDETTTEADELAEKKIKRFNARCQKHLQQTIAKQAFWADAMRSGIEAPYDAYADTSGYCNVSKHHYVDVDGEESYQLDEEETVKEFARIVQWAKSRGYGIRKDYKDDEFNLYVDTHNELIGTINFYSTRQVVCKKVVTGTKIVPAQPEKIEEVTEWVCDKVAFLNVPV